ncbi:helix-turn-helix domain-containing protein [Streptomyces sp. NPDC048604]|uniref:helix-turn-helix domain-containing protein n=1 Tax=Streptomyces sp. NPDC048604 TaxID=3365578 RepID=UPI00372153C6
MDQTTTARNLELQRQWYGAPLGELCRDLRTLFGVTQSALAEIIGISPAMLSLVMRGQRARIANPDAAARLSAALHLAHEVRAGTVPPDAVADRLDEVRSSRTPGQDSLGAAAPTTPPDGALPPDAELRFVRRLRDLLTSTSGAIDLLDAADLLAPRHPDLAEILRTCGAGRTDEAVALVRRLTQP